MVRVVTGIGRWISDASDDSDGGGSGRRGGVGRRLGIVEIEAPGLVSHDVE